MKYKYVYDVHHYTKFGFGVQPIKGNNKKEAKARFKKRFPKKRVIDVEKRDTEPFGWNPAI